MNNTVSDNLYDRLGVAPEASKAEIDRAYRQQARHLHPDKNKAADAAEQFRNLKEAHDILSDPERRKAYDAKYNAAGANERPHPTAPTPQPTKGSKANAKNESDNTAAPKEQNRGGTLLTSGKTLIYEYSYGVGGGATAHVKAVRHIPGELQVNDNVGMQDLQKAAAKNSAPAMSSLADTTDMPRLNADETAAGLGNTAQSGSIKGQELPALPSSAHDMDPSIAGAFSPGDKEEKKEPEYVFSPLRTTPTPGKP